MAAETLHMGERDEFRYATSGDVSIAFTADGTGPPDIVFVHGFVGNIEVEREMPEASAFYERIASFARFVTFDRRGTGLSDRPREAATLETRMDDLRAVLDAIASERAVLFGTYEAASMCLLFAATYPERTAALVLYNPVAKGAWAPDYPWAGTPEEKVRQNEDLLAGWGTSALAKDFLRSMAPTFADDAEYVAAQARLMRLSASPGAVATIQRMAANVDVRDVLGAIGVPTLVANIPGTREEAEFITARIPGARRFEIPGPDFLIVQQTETLLPEVERFVQGLDRQVPETVLTTVLFTDIVGSTAKLAELGDAGWRALVERHHALVRQQLSRFRGEEVDTAGDGFFARFDGPIRAVRCAEAIAEAVAGLGLDIRAGLHTGECELVDGKVAGIAVNVGARVAALAGPREVLVSSTVKDLVAGSDLEFEDRGVAELKGVPGEWRLFAVR
jgi:class 3 adenylate cyclase/alpha-beta hydrolase superfamily lysophospholipase